MRKVHHLGMETILPIKLMEILVLNALLMVVSFVPIVLPFVRNVRVECPSFKTAVFYAHLIA